MKNPIRNGIIAALVLSNVVTCYQFTATYKEHESKLKDKESKIQTLLDINFERNSLVENQQSIIHTYEDEVLKLNNQIKEKEIKIDKLTKQVAEAKRSDKELP